MQSEDGERGSLFGTLKRGLTGLNLHAVPGQGSVRRDPSASIRPLLRPHGGRGQWQPEQGAGELGHKHVATMRVYVQRRRQERQIGKEIARRLKT